MRNLILLLLAASILYGCSGDDDNLRNKIAGPWKLESIEIYNPEGNIFKDYSNENIIYNFKNNGKLVVTGADNLVHHNGEYSYKLINKPADQNNGNTNVYIQIDNTQWAYISNATDEMTLSIGYIDGPTLSLVRKNKN